MKKMLFIGNTGFSLFNFRLPLMEHLRDRGLTVVAVASDEGGYAARFKERGIRFIDIRIDHKGKNPFNDLRCTFQLKSLYKHEQPDCVHHFTIKPVIFGSIAAKWSGIPFIVNTITGLGYVFQRQGMLLSIIRLLYKLSFNGKPRIIFQNGDDYRLFKSYDLVDENNCSVILGSGVNTKLIFPIESRRPRNQMRYLLVSRMLWSKGVKEYVAASKLIRQRFPESNFTMAGGVSGGGARGNPDAIPEAWLNDVNESGTVRWVGRVPFDEVLTLLDATDVVVLPSYSEGVPRALIEAAAKGKPIVTTDAPGCREVVKDGVNGFLIPPMDVPILVNRLVNFIQEPEIIEQMGVASREIAVALFDEEKIIAQTIGVYSKLGLM